MQKEGTGEGNGSENLGMALKMSIAVMNLVWADSQFWILLLIVKI